MMTIRQQQQMLQTWAPNTSGGEGHGSEQLEDMTGRMANMNMNQMQQQQQGLKSKQISAMQASMMRASMPPHVNQQTPQPRSGPSKLSMMTNQQLMMLAQTVTPWNFATSVRQHAGAPAAPAAPTPAPRAGHTYIMESRR